MVTLIAPVGGLNGPAPTDLSPDTALHILPGHVRATFESIAQAPPILPLSGWYNHCLVLRRPDSCLDGDDGPRDAVDEVVLRLRIHAPGSVGYNVVLVDRSGWYDAPGTHPAPDLTANVMWFYVVWQRPGMRLLYEFNANDVGALQTLFRETADHRLLERPAFRLFFRGYHEPYATDRFLANAIGLESVLANDENDISNIRYKFIDRGCYLLQEAMPDAGGAPVFVQPLKEIYDARCSLVHTRKGGKPDWETTDEQRILRNSEDFLRALLKLLLRRPDLASCAAVDAAKREDYGAGRRRTM